MGNTRNTGYLQNAVKVADNGDISLMHGNTMLMQISASGAITTTGVISGSNALSASYAVNATTASFASSATSASYALNATTASYALSATSASFTIQAQTASSADAFTVRNTLTAQTLVVQTITSSVDFVTGSTRFGSILGNTHVFSGSVTMNPGGLFVSSSGNVGIGTTTPIIDLQIGNRTILQNVVNAQSSYANNVFYNGTNWFLKDAGTGTAVRLNSPDSIGDISFHTIASGSAGTNVGTEMDTTGVKMIIKNNGNVGIGTSSPQSFTNYKTLQISNTAGGVLFVESTTASMIGQLVADNGVSSVVVGARTNHPLYFTTNNVERIRITTGGNVGIGTSSTGFNAAGLPLVIGSGSGNTGLTIFSGASGAGSIHFADTETTGAGSYAGFINYDHTANSMQFGTTEALPTERMRIASTGHVGIGVTPSPWATGTTALQIGNTVNLWNRASDGLLVLGSNSYFNGSADIQITTGTSNRIYFVNGGIVFDRAASTSAGSNTPWQTSMTITAAGSVGIGTTASDIVNNHNFGIARDGVYSGDVHSSQLALCGVTDTRMRISMGYDTTNNFGYIVAGQLGVTWTSLWLQRTAGAVYAGSARIDNNSDIRVKDNIQPITGALDKVLSMNGKKFHMVDEPEDKIRMGFIAQELQGVVDELVIESDRTQKLPSGEIIENVLGLETWGSSWAALLVEAMKELKAENDTLKEILQRNNIQ